MNIKSLNEFMLVDDDLYVKVEKEWREEVEGHNGRPSWLYKSDVKWVKCSIFQQPVHESKIISNNEEYQEWKSGKT